MRIIKLILLLIIFSFSKVNMTFAQTIKEPTFKADSLSLFEFLNVYFYYHFLEKKELYNCEHAFAIVKFNLNKEALVKNIEFSIGTPEHLKPVLTEMLKATNGHWKPRMINSKPVESLPFMLPVMFHLNWGCKEESKQNLGYGIWNMLLFQNKTDSTIVRMSESLRNGYRELQGTLLHPIIIANSTKE